MVFHIPAYTLDSQAAVIALAATQMPDPWLSSLAVALVDWQRPFVSASKAIKSRSWKSWMRLVAEPMCTVKMALPLMRVLPSLQRHFC